MSLKGIFAPTLTPLGSDLSPDKIRLTERCRWLLQNGCHGLAVFGTTSEANSFSVEERLDVLEHLVAAGIPAGQLMPGAGCCALPDTVRLTAHAVKLGCGGVLMLPPFYYKGVSDDGLFASYSEVIQRVGDSRLRIYLYHIPPVSQVPISHNLIERLIGAYPKVVVGMKDSSGDWNNILTTLTRFPGFATFTGSEKFLLPTLRAGGVGTICAVANVISPALRHLYDHWQSAEAEKWQEEVSELRRAIQPYQAIAALKVIVSHLLADPAWRTVRPPLIGLTPEQSRTLLASLPAEQVPLPVAAVGVP